MKWTSLNVMCAPAGSAPAGSAVLLAGDPRVLQDLSCRGSLRRVAIEELDDEVLGLLREPGPRCRVLVKVARLARLDAPNGVLVARKGRYAGQHHEERAAEAPHVRGHAGREVGPLAVLGRHVHVMHDPALSFLVVLREAGAAEVDQLEVHVTRRDVAYDHRVLRLDVGVDDPGAVEVLYGLRQLQEEGARLLLYESVCGDDIEQVLTFDELHEHEYHGLGLDDALVADDPRVRTHLGAVSAEIILDARALVLVLELVDLQREVHAAGQVRAPEGAVPALADFVTPRGLEHVQHVVIDRAERDLVHGKTFRTAEARLRAVLREGALSCIRERLQALHALHDALDLALCPAGLLHALLGLGLPLLHLILELLLRRLLLVVDLFQAIHQALQLPLPCFHVRGAVGLQASDLLLQL
mmetsp:Transcript_10760/g.37672  ORF Transcript_10760/g.37672 Transcript_10760/m.37672 type:complete len:413 (-) Transcript_10760:184-1422(-)